MSTNFLKLAVAYSIDEIRAIEHDLQRKVEVLLLWNRARYVFDPASTAEDDGDEVLAPSVASPCKCCGESGRWIKWAPEGGGGGDGADLSDADPLPDAAIADPGVGTEAARWDHVHPLPDAADPIDVVVDAELVKQEIVKTDSAFSTSSTTGAAVTGTTINLSLDEETEVMIFVSGPLYYLAGGDLRTDGFLGVKVNSSYYFGGHAYSSNLGQAIASPGSFAKVVTLAAGDHTIDAALKSLGTNDAKLLIDGDRPLTLEVVYLEKTVDTIIPSFGSGMQPSDDDPLPLAAVADPGVSNEASRADHVHPLDGVATETYADDAADAAEAAAKLYADNLVAGLAWKQACRAATTVAGTLATDFENGDTIDGVVLATGDRILIKNQAAPAENGVYVVAASGAPTRATDANSAAELESAAVFVQEGTVNANTAWNQTEDNFVLGVGTIAWAQFEGGQITAGDCLERIGNVIGVEDDTITDTKVASANKDGTAATPSMRTLGTSATQAGAGDTSPAAVLTTKGDVLVRSSTAPTRLPIGSTDGMSLVVVGAETASLKYLFNLGIYGAMQFGTGVDSSLVVAAGTTTLGVGVGCHNFTTLTINSGGTLRNSAGANFDGLIIFCSTSLTMTDSTSIITTQATSNSGSAVTGPAGSGGGGKGGDSAGMNNCPIFIYAKHILGTGLIRNNGSKGGAGANATVATTIGNGSTANNGTTAEQKSFGVTFGTGVYTNGGAGGGGQSNGTGGTGPAASGGWTDIAMSMYKDMLQYNSWSGSGINYGTTGTSGNWKRWHTLPSGSTGGAGGRNTGAQGAGGGGSGCGQAPWPVGTYTQAQGGAAGGAGLAGAAGSGGGGGGAGSIGGIIWIVAITIAATIAVQAIGGDGGNGGNGFGNGGGGASGVAGDGGWICLIVLYATSCTTDVSGGTVGTVGTGSGGAANGNQGAAGRPGNVWYFPALMS